MAQQFNLSLIDRRATLDSSIESFDQVSPAEQMKAIDEALRAYFGADDWLAARHAGVCDEAISTPKD